MSGVTDMLERMTLKEAGEALGISPDAVRMRINRGTMQGEKDDEGRWQVWVDVQAAAKERAEAQEAAREREPAEDVALRQQVAVLEARLEDLQSERDFLRIQIDNLVMTQAMTAQAQTHKALEKPRWKWPWNR